MHSRASGQTLGSKEIFLEKNLIPCSLSFQGHSQLLAAANKHGPHIWFTLQNLDIKFKYIFQVTDNTKA